jgi:hypothetical protein
VAVGVDRCADRCTMHQLVEQSPAGRCARRGPVFGMSARRTSYPGAVRRSTALAELARHGFDVVETDVPPWSEWSETAGGYVWREALVSELLEVERRTTPAVRSPAAETSEQGRAAAVTVLLASVPAVLRAPLRPPWVSQCGCAKARRATAAIAARCCCWRRSALAHSRVPGASSLRDALRRKCE